MAEPMIRGHVIRSTSKFFRTQCDPSVALRVDSALPIELRTTLPEISPAVWYPLSFQVELLSALAATHGTETETRADLERCGAALAVGDNEFMQLLMKVLTPELFLKKLTRFWDRDHRSAGQPLLERLDIGARNATVRLCGVAGYPHSGLIWHGWMQRIFTEICGSPAAIEQRGWTWSEPAPDEILYEVKWS